MDILWMEWIVFGLIHIITYEADTTHCQFMWLITLSQIFGGLILGYVRVIYGFWYAVLLHALSNAVAVFCGVLKKMLR